MIVSCSNQINRIFEFDLNWNTLNAFSAQSALIIASKSKNFATCGEYNSMNTSTSYFIYWDMKEWIRDIFLLHLTWLVVILTIVEGKFFYIGKTHWLSNRRSVGIGNPELIWLSCAIIIELKLVIKLIGVKWLIIHFVYNRNLSTIFNLRIINSVYK